MVMRDIAPAPATPLSSNDVEHYSPPEVVDPARETLGVIDLDPFTNMLANRVVVKATLAYVGPNSPHGSDEQHLAVDGFAQPWRKRVFVNPPGGKIGRESSQVVAWKTLMRQRSARVVEVGIYVCFNLGFLQTTQTAPQGWEVPLDFPICYPDHRIGYLVDRLPGATAKQPNRKPSKRQVEDFERTGLCEGESPPGASCIVLVTPLDANLRDFYINRFEAAYKSLGKVVIPR